jgi:hypothetical protein
MLEEGFQQLLNRDWFKRVWIIQETVNAQVAEVVCGGKSVSASVFARTPSFLKITLDSHCQRILEIMPGPIGQKSWWNEKRDLHTILGKFRGSDATDLRDKIYALLGISSDACNPDFPKPDYGKSIEDVVFDTTSFLLNFKLDSSVNRFLDWTLEIFLENLESLANEVLKCAINANQRSIVKLLVARSDIDVELEVNGKAPLSWAAKMGHETVVKQLLKAKADVELKDKDG